MEVRNLKNTGWYVSYMRDEQGKALIECQEKKIKQLTDLIENIKGEIELTKEPKEYNTEMVLASIEALIDQTKEVEHIRGYFKWVG
ncbi:hypothetical protein [Tenacibaculum finnmarkense]|uniref:hypothetical protein n=1 Tax=Tenacibaculum finnmarkense TaxID=2781243 RepID=UPI001E395DEA|nr:hypothetical protein [Tenacibaculum finnmarkense]MCD8413609.1 hypothetical protein [Tenacibaculum finnmarkense genomovar ulcerans]